MNNTDPHDEMRLLIATFIVATLIAYLQLDTERIDDWLWLGIGMLVLPLIAAAGFAFLFIIIRGLSLEILILKDHQRQLVYKLSQVLYSMSVVCYGITLPAVLLALGLIKVVSHFTTGLIPLWPGYFIIVVLILLSLYVTISGFIKAELTYRKRVCAQLSHTYLLYQMTYK